MLGKLRVLSAGEVCRILEQNGFVQVRQRGSHIIMQMQTEDSTITVPGLTQYTSQTLISLCSLCLCGLILP
jgi:predicted RNA binding protein YcfA (HicA-like mRNA interferase family)